MDDLIKPGDLTKPGLFSPGPFEQWRMASACTALTLPEKSALLALMLHARPADGFEAWPSHACIAAYGSLGISTTQRALTRLEGRGLIRTERRWIDPEYADRGGYGSDPNDRQRRYLYERPRGGEYSDQASNLYTVSWLELLRLPSYKGYAAKWLRKKVR